MDSLLERHAVGALDALQASVDHCQGRRAEQRLPLLVIDDLCRGVAECTHGQAVSHCHQQVGEVIDCDSRAKLQAASLKEQQVELLSRFD